MNQGSALRRAAAPADSSPATALRRPDSPAEQLERLSSRLDEPIRDVRLGTTSHRQHDRNVDEAEAIATELRAVFRGGAGAPATNSPIWQSGGRAAW